MNANLTSRVTETFKVPFPVNEETNVNEVERALSIASGTFICYKALTNIAKHPIIALQEAAVGGYLVFRGATGYCPIYAKIGKDSSDLQPVTITQRFIVSQPREEVYSFWRKLENLPRFMKHLESVEQKDEKHSYWKAKVPGKLLKIDWNAEITREEENSYLGWQSIEGSMIDNAGRVEFKDAVSGAGTELNIEISYFPPAGQIGRGVASLFNGMFEKMVRDDVTNFKHFVEGEEYKTYSSPKLQS